MPVLRERLTEIKAQGDALRIIRSKRRTLGLEVADDASLIVRAPHRVPLETIEDLVRKKQLWIRKKQRLARETFVPPVEKKFSEGEEFLYLGRRYPLRLSEESGPLLFNGKEFLLSRPRVSEGHEQFISWYRRRAFEILRERTGFYGEQAGLKSDRIKITGAKKRWGSCNAKGGLTFTWRLILAPLEIVDYVAAHELAHLAEHNHSRRFWERVRKMVPEYQQARAWLREHHRQLDV